MRDLRIRKLLQEKMDASQKLAGMKKGKEVKEEHVNRRFLSKIATNSFEVGKCGCCCRPVGSRGEGKGGRGGGSLQRGGGEVRGAKQLGAGEKEQL